jgi:hypothetical protein
MAPSMKLAVPFKFRLRLRANAAMCSLLALHLFIARTSRAAADDESARSLPLLTNIQQVLQLGREGARQHPHPVEFEAVTTVPVAGQPTSLWVQAETNAIFVAHTNRFTRQPGLRVRVRGVTGTWPYGVNVQRARVEVLGTNALPEPLRLPVAHLFRAEFLGRWIEQEGVIRTVVHRGPTDRLSLFCR